MSCRVVDFLVSMSAADTVRPVGALLEEDDEVMTNTHTEESTETNLFFLRFAQNVKPYRLPNYTEIANSALERFQDPALKVTMKRKGAEKIYKIQLSSKIKAEGHSLLLPCNGVDVRIPLTTVDPLDTKHTQEKGILLTFAGAFDGEMESIPNSSFDQAVANFNLQILVPTRLQKVPGSSALNGNRYCILKTVDDTNSIPEYLPVTHPVTKKLFNVRSTFKGQARSCTRCLKKHVGQCPELKAFYEALNKRKQLKEEGKITTKIISDSTMRLADPLGLNAEVSTMSGGGIGQVLQAACDDPEIMTMKDVVVVGGTNDINCTSFDTNEEFAQNIDTTIERIINVATENPDKTFTFVNSHPSEIVRDPVNTSVRTSYLHKKMAHAASTPNINVVDIAFATDNTGHPSSEGTKTILYSLQDSLRQSLVREERYVVANRNYQRVEELFRYGCNHCDRFGIDIQHTLRNPILCDICHQANKNAAQTGRYPLLEKIFNEMNEYVLNDETNISEDGKPSNKRLKSSDGKQ